MKLAYRCALVVPAFAVALLTRGCPAGAADVHCSHDALAFEGTALNITLCATPSPKTVAIAETFATKSASFSHSTTIDILAGETSSRGIDDVPLVPLGLTKTLHLTMRYKSGAIALEHALLLPGAVPLK